MFQFDRQKLKVCFYKTICNLIYAATQGLVEKFCIAYEPQKESSEII